MKMSATCAIALPAARAIALLSDPARLAEGLDEIRVMPLRETREGPAWEVAGTFRGQYRDTDVIRTAQTGETVTYRAVIKGVRSEALFTVSGDAPATTLRLDLTLTAAGMMGQIAVLALRAREDNLTKRLTLALSRLGRHMTRIGGAAGT